MNPLLYLSHFPARRHRLPSFPGLGCPPERPRNSPRQDYQDIFDGAAAHSRNASIGKYVKTYEPGIGWFLRPKGMLGGGTLLISEDGSVYSKPILPHAGFKLLMPPGSVTMGAGDTFASPYHRYKGHYHAPREISFPH